MLLTIAVSILWTLCVSLPMSASAEFHLMGQYKPRKSFEQKGRALGTQRHEVLISIEKKNMDEFQQMVLERATPGSASYQQWFSYDEVTAIVQNPEAFERVQAWLGEHDVRVNWVSPRRDYISAETTVQKWEELLDAQFFEFHDHSYRLESGQPQLEPTSFVRSLSYSIPQELRGDIDAIFGTVQAPIAYHKSFYVPEEHPEQGPPVTTTLRAEPQKIFKTSFVRSVTVDHLNSYYRIQSNLANPKLNQSVFMTSNEYFSPTDLENFQKKYDLTVQPAISIGGHTLERCPTTSALQSCMEGNLDIQYIMGVAQRAASIFWYVPRKSGVDSFATWLTKMVNMKNPPQSNSMSWGAIEQEVALSTMKTFDKEAAILSGMGVTIVIASGDNGVANVNCACTSNSGRTATGTDWAGSTTWSGQGYFPSFPATSPWVTAVGGTMGRRYTTMEGTTVVPSIGKPEIACQSNQGGIITSGGGFSTYYPMPDYQKKTVANYFSQLSNDTKAAPGYNPEGRAYPDISFLAVSYDILIGGGTNPMPIYGTSASAPAFAGMITLINSLRNASGLPNVGFINPTLYSVGYNNTMKLENIFGPGVYFTDVTSGHNKCCFSTTDAAECCDSGFETARGWDPVTGFGSIQFPRLAGMFSVSAPYSAASSLSIRGGFVGALILTIIAVLSVFLF